MQHALVVVGPSPMIWSQAPPTPPCIGNPGSMNLVSVPRMLWAPMLRGEMLIPEWLLRLQGVAISPVLCRLQITLDAGHGALIMPPAQHRAG